MDIILSKINEDPNTLVKTINEPFSISGTLKNITDKTNPEITIAGDVQTLLTYNYCYINEFQRYYYITNISVENSNLITISCKCDVLMSFSTEILNLNVVLDRQENSFNMYYTDSEIPVMSYKFVQAKLFSKNPITTTNQHIIIKLCGGAT